MTDSRRNTLFVVILGGTFLAFLIMACAGIDPEPTPPSCTTSAYNPVCPSPQR